MLELGSHLQVAEIPGATLVPPSKFSLKEDGRRFDYDGGVYGADGENIAMARHPGANFRNIPAPTCVAPTGRTLPGRYLFGGWIRFHFGHFINESLGRLWATRIIADKLDGIIFLPYGRIDLPTRAARLRQAMALTFVADTFKLLNLEAPVSVVDESVTVEHLLVPEYLSLTPRLSSIAGTRMQAAFIRSLADGPLVPKALSLPRIYVSRHGLGPTRSMFLLEDRIERNLIESGYAIVRPQDLPIAGQLAAYSGIRRAIFAEGSAIHLAAAFATSGTNCAVLARRFGSPRVFVGQIEAAGCRQATMISARKGAVGSWNHDEEPTSNSKNDRFSHALLDFEQLGKELLAQGLIEPGTWQCPSEAEIEAAIADSIAEKRKAFPQLHSAYLADAS